MPEPAAGVRMRPAGALHLLGPKWRIARARARSAGGSKPERLTLLAVFGGGVLYGAYALMVRVLRYFRSAEDIGGILAGKVLAMLLLAFSSILLLSNVIGALSSGYLSRDLDQLAAAPVSRRALYTSRLIETVLHSSWMVVLLLLPIMCAYGTVYQGGTAFVWFAPAVLLPYFIIPAALGSLFTLLLVNVFPARRTRDVLSVVAALAVAGVVVLFRMARPEQLVKPEGFANFMDFIAALNAPASPILPSEWASHAIMGFLRGGPTWAPLGRLWLVAAATVVIGGVVHALLWARGFSQAQEGATKRTAVGAKRPLLDRALAWLPPARRELVLKECRVFARDSTQWSQLVMLAVLLVVYVANVRYLPLRGEGVSVLLRQLIPFLNLALAGFVLASIAGRFVFPSVSLEGRALWLLRSSPLAMRDLLWAKFWVGVLPLLLLAIAIVGATNTLLEVTPFVHVVSLAAIVLLVFPLTALALAYGAHYPQYDAENAAQIPTSFGGLVFMLTAIVLIAAVAYGTGRPAARFVVAEHFGWQFESARLIPPFVMVAITCVAFTLVPLRMAEKKLLLLERG